ncbi:putative Fungal-specific transcription factor domain-containing protein [Seiridium cardinale]|uniref:Fungal-specific transcription factor domain-containing protein n=1 Tax=Seiridium cardinale TaxID=138064 RepID=A0ABR2XTW3_9PEZI
MADSRERQRRRKIPLACEPCRDRKSRCDGGKPICLSCQRRGLSLDQCIYTVDNARTASKDSYIKVLHDRIHYLEQKLNQHDIAFQPFGSEASPVPEAHPSGALPPSQVSGPTVDSPRVAGTNPSMVPLHHGSVSGTSPGSLDKDDAGRGITAMGTIAAEGEIDGSFDAFGEFYGASSAASFMQEAMATAKSPNQLALPLMNPPSPDTGRKTAGPRPFYFNYTHSESFSLPPRSLADHLLERFWDKIFYIYPIFHRPAFEQAYQNLWKTQDDLDCTTEYTGVGLGSSLDTNANTPIFHCALNTIFAIGSTFSDLAAEPKETAVRSFFLKSKSFVGLDLLELNNIGVVQCLLLMAVFLQSTPFPSRCWNAVGVACRVAMGLGLHIDTPRGDMSQLEIDISRRTWHGCVNLDMVVSMTFGRPTMTANIPPLPMPVISDDISPANDQNEGLLSRECPSRLLFFNEYSSLCNLLKVILTQVYEGSNNGFGTEAMHARAKVHDFKMILELDSKLASFAESLPPILSWKKPQDLAEVPKHQRLTFETQRVVLHGRFLYLQIMLHRPILTQLSVTNQLATQGLPTNDSALCNSLYSSFTVECAKTCVNAAMELIELVHKTHRTAATGGWWWDGLYACTSGLILIVSQLHPQVKASFAQHEIQRHWKFCDAILEHLTSHSASVQKSLKLLRNIRNDVMPGRNISSQNGARDGLSKDASSIHQDIPQPAIGELVDILPFELMNDSNMVDMPFDWNQSIDFFSNDISFESFQ